MVLESLEPLLWQCDRRTGRWFIRPSSLTAGLFQQHLELTGGDPQYLAIWLNSTNNLIALVIGALKALRE